MIIKLSSGEVLKDEVDVLFIRIAAIEVNDIGMIYLFHNVHLFFKRNLFLLVHFLSK